MVRKEKKRKERKEKKRKVGINYRHYLSSVSIPREEDDEFSCCFLSTTLKPKEEAFSSLFTVLPLREEHLYLYFNTKRKMGMGRHQKSGVPARWVLVLCISSFLLGVLVINRFFASLPSFIVQIYTVIDT